MAGYCTARDTHDLIFYSLEKSVSVLHVVELQFWILPVVDFRSVYPALVVPGHDLQPFRPGPGQGFALLLADGHDGTRRRRQHASGTTRERARRPDLAASILHGGDSGGDARCEGCRVVQKTTSTR